MQNIDLTIFTKIKVSKLYQKSSNLFVAGLSVTHTETSQSDFHIYIVISHQDSSRLSHLTFPLTLPHHLSKVHQFNQSQLIYYPLHGKSIIKFWQSYCTLGHDQSNMTNSSTYPSRTCCYFMMTPLLFCTLGNVET